MNDDLRAFARELFARADDEGDSPTSHEAPPPDPTRNNVAPREGNNPTGEADDMQTFVRNLFDRSH